MLQVCSSCLLLSLGAQTRQLIETCAGNLHVHLVGSDHLARMADAYIRGKPLADKAVMTEISPCLVEREGRRTAIVALARTHHSFLTNLFRRQAPWTVDWLAPAGTIGR